MDAPRPHCGLDVDTKTRVGPDGLESDRGSLSRGDRRELRIGHLQSSARSQTLRVVYCRFDDACFPTGGEKVVSPIRTRTERELELSLNHGLSRPQDVEILRGEDEEENDQVLGEIERQGRDAHL